MILSFLFFTFLAYLVFRLVFDFVLPVYRTTRRVRQTFRSMNEQMRQNAQGPSAAPQQKKPADEKMNGLGEYIDFEEVKE